MREKIQLIADSIGCTLGGYIINDDVDDTSMIHASMVDFLLADLRDHGGGTEGEDESVGFLAGRENLLQPLGGGRDILAVFPGIEVILSESMMQESGKCDVLV